MENLPLADADAGVTTLMSLIAVVTTEVLHGASRVDGNFVDGKKSETFSAEVGNSLFNVSASLSETVFA